MTYSSKREFAARVFAAVLAGVTGAEWSPGQMIRLLTQAQIDALGPEVDLDLYAIDAAYALAVKLAPLVGVEVPDGKS